MSLYPPVPLPVETLREDIDAGRIDTVIIAVTDMQGRLQGKRLTARHFLDQVLDHGTEGCSYQLAVDVDMNTVAGYELTSWERGYGDFVFDPDLATLRYLPWLDRTALLLADIRDTDGDAVVQSPRQILQAQVARLAERGWTAFTGTELEFILFDTSYEDAWANAYRMMTPANQYNVDYSILGTSRVEGLLRAIVTGMEGAGIYIESAKGECNYGQHEIALKYADAVACCDNHVVYKNGVKEIAAQHSRSATFMAKYDQRDGSSCHIHLSLRDQDGTPVFAGDGTGDTHGFSKVFEHWIAGQIACLREISLLIAPNINSYKRFVDGSFAPTAIAWGRDNRTCALRVVGHSPDALRVENRVPGADVNPYLAVAALIAAGLHGVENELPLGPALAGNAYASAAERVPAALHVARDLFSSSAFARSAFGDTVVDHYTHMADIEIAAFGAAITDWERFRGFERL